LPDLEDAVEENKEENEDEKPPAEEKAWRSLKSSLGNFLLTSWSRQTAI